MFNFFLKNFYAIIKAEDKPTTPMYRQIRSDVVIFLKYPLRKGRRLRLVTVAAFQLAMLDYECGFLSGKKGAKIDRWLI